MSDDERALSAPVTTLDLYPPAVYLKAAHLGGKEPVLVIESIGRREVKKKVAGAETWVLEPWVDFVVSPGMKARGIPGRLMLNKTNLKALETMFGGTVADWKGKGVELGTTRDRNPGTGEMGPCLRVKGSPDIDKPCVFVIQKKKASPVKHTMRKTVVKPQPKKENEQ